MIYRMIQTDLIRAVTEIIKRGHAVGLGPHSDGTRVLDVLVIGFDVKRADE